VNDATNPETFEQQNLSYLKRSVSRLSQLIEIGAPAQLIGPEINIIECSALAAFGPEIYAEIGRSVITQMRLHEGYCATCPGSPRLATHQGMCDECSSEGSVLLAAAEAEEVEP
jgi:hypothetical protein